MSLVAEYESSSESDSGSNKGQAADGGAELAKNEVTEENHTNGKSGDSENNTSPAKTPVKLPSASSVMKRKISSETFVLNNEYKKVEEDKSKVLEQHVKMVKNTKSVPVNGKVNGKMVCWMYRRGRCRLGKKCKMYHDSELRDAEAKQNSVSEDKPKEQSMTYTPSPQKRNYSEVVPEEENDEPQNKIHKKRFGVSDDIVPSKKVLKHLEKISNESQPGQ